MKRILVFLIGMFSITSCWAGEREDALGEFEKFFAYFTADNHDQLVSLFSQDALFIGTISPELVTDPAGLREYFVKALTSTRGQVKANLFGTTATWLADGVVLVTAHWQSERTLDGKTSTNGPSRNTSVMHKRGNRWYIVQFHNSWKPK